MRLRSATGYVAVALLATACASKTHVRMPDGDAMATSLASLGIEGKTYRNDLGQVRALSVRGVHAVDDDFLIEDLHGHLTYVDGGTLNPKWEYYGLPGPLDHRPDHTPTAIIGVSKSRAFVLSRINGVEEMAPRTTGVVASAAPVATDSTLYIPTYPTPSGNKSIYSISLGSGYLGWGVRTDTDIQAATAKGGPLGGDTLYFATVTGGIYAYPTSVASDSQPEAAWFTHARSSIHRDLTVSGDDLGVVTGDNRLICMNRVTGNVRWEAYPEPGDRAESTAQFSAGHAFYRVSGELRAFDRATGAKAWTCPGATAYVGTRNGRMILTGEDGWVLSVDAKTGKVLSKSHLPGVVFPRQEKANSTFYAFSDDGLLMAVEFGW